jgi:hypothetical protein
VDDQTAPVIVTDELLAAWSFLADEQARHLRPGDINWVMIVRSLIAEINILRTSG